jgi:Ti-type conjugative transfer relaxase TraA
LAIYHLQMKPISRSSGRSAVASAAYRAAEKLTNEREGQTHDFTRKEGVEHAEIVLPEASSADWARDRSKLWNAAEFSENRKDARVAREFEIGLPHELSKEQRLELTREFAAELANRYGAAVDFTIHRPHEESDVRNHHAHVMMTTRKVEDYGLGDKTHMEWKNERLLGQGLPTSHMQLSDIRQSWEDIANERLAKAGLEIRVDHRSHAERGLEIAPTEHMGVHATQMQRRGKPVDRARVDEAATKRNAELIREKPEQVLTLITNEKSVFDRHDVARVLHRYINDDQQTFQNAFAKVMASPALVELQAEQRDGPNGAQLARYSTKEMIEIERAMAASASRMGVTHRHGANRYHVDMAISVQDEALRSSVASDTFTKLERGEMTSAEREHQIDRAQLSDEQRNAIRHITGSEQLSAVVGFAGAGKSTMLTAARYAWEAQGYKVHGAALSGKAAEGLEESSGIASRTLASWEYAWQAERGQLGPNDIFVIDEAGMVGSRQMARFVGEAERAGAKLVLVGDHEQLQAIGAGAPFRAIAELVGFAELQEIRRQRENWQREASVAFASHRTGEGLAAYENQGAIQFNDTREGARSDIVRDYLADRDERPDGSRIAMAHRRKDVRALNADIRSALQERGELATGEAAGEREFETNDGKRSFAAGDRIVFLQNDRDLGVKNGMLGTVTSVEPDALQVQLDGRTRGGDRGLHVPIKDYQAVDHGYATTIHKTQGATVDRGFVLASQTMDRHLTYVAMTRHRDGVALYAALDEFKDMANLSATLSRSGAKETTLDYEKDFAERRGIAGQLGIESEIALEKAGEPPQELTSRADNLAGEPHSRSADRSAYEEQAVAGSERDGAETIDRQPSQRRSAFAGLKLGRVPDTSKLPERSPTAEERQPQAESPKRRMFAGLKLNAAQEPSQREGREVGKAADRSVAPADVRVQSNIGPASGFEQSVDRYARAFSAAAKMQERGLPILESQKSEMRAAGQQMENARPGSSDLTRSALRQDPEMKEIMMERSGRDRVGKLIDGMEKERAQQADPNVRADRIIDRWQALQEERTALSGWQQDEARGKIEGEMRKMTAEIEKDPQVETIVRERAQEIGISHVRENKGITGEMEQQLARGHSQGLER